MNTFLLVILTSLTCSPPLVSADHVVAVCCRRSSPGVSRLQLLARPGSTRRRPPAALGPGLEPTPEPATHIRVVSLSSRKSITTLRHITEHCLCISLFASFSLSLPTNLPLSSCILPSYLPCVIINYFNSPYISPPPQSAHLCPIAPPVLSLLGPVDVRLVSASAAVVVIRQPVLLHCWEPTTTSKYLINICYTFILILCLTVVFVWNPCTSKYMVRPPSAHNS